MNNKEECVASILIVDDVNSNLLLMSGILSDYDIITSTSGKDALKIVQDRHVDLILLDITMPDMNGFEVCTELKSMKKTKDIPIVFVTSNSNEESIERAYEVGGVDYVTKPIKSKELLARVKTQVSYSMVKEELNEKLALINKYVSYSFTDTKGVITDVSDAFCHISGYTKDELIGHKHSMLKDPQTSNELYKSLWDTITKGNSWTGEIRNLKKDGSHFWADVIISPMCDKHGEIYGYSAIRHDITYQKKVEVLSVTDQLTALYNRRYFNDMFPVEIKRSIRQSTCISLLTLDVDFFKQYNDTYGHQDGDKVLQAIGTTMKNQAKRAEDLMFRLGGEEFGIIYTTNTPEDSVKIANRVKDSIEDLKIEHRRSSVSKYITISIGLACVDFSKEQNHYVNEDIIYKLADDELYKSKAQGRNRVSSVIL